MAMWRFVRSERKEVWDEAIEWPLGDIEAAQKIREICRTATGSAEKVGGVPDRSGAREVGREDVAAGDDAAGSAGAQEPAPSH